MELKISDDYVARKITVITPIKHIDGLDKAIELIDSNANFLERCTKIEARETILSATSNTIICNPNAQDFVIDKDLLIDTSINTILTCSTGLNHIDIEYCKENDIEVLSLKDDLDLLNDLPSTSELAFGLMLSLIRFIPKSYDSVKQGEWDYTRFIGHELKSMKVGIVGLGRLGKMMHKYCAAFGAQVRFYDPNEDFYTGKTSSLQELVDWADIISLHVHVSGDTKQMINENLWKRRTKPLYLINTSRGDIVNELDVVRALKLGKLSGYATDVVTDEFGIAYQSPIIKASFDPNMNIIITPHIGGMTIEGQRKAYYHALDKLTPLPLIATH